MLETEVKLHCPSNKGFCRGKKKLNPTAIFWTQAILMSPPGTQGQGGSAALITAEQLQKNDRGEENGTVEKTQRHFVLTAV